MLPSAGSSERRSNDSKVPKDDAMRCKVCSSIRQSEPLREKKATGLRVESQRREYQAHASQGTGGRVLLLWRRRDGRASITVEVKGQCIVKYIDTSGGAYSQSQHSYSCLAFTSPPGRDKFSLPLEGRTQQKDYLSWRRIDHGQRRGSPPQVF